MYLCISRYEQDVPESFHVSKACVEPQSTGGGPTSVYQEKEGGAEEFLLCNLSSKVGWRQKSRK